MFTHRELDLIKKAVSYMMANLPDVEEALDCELDSKEVTQLEEKLYKQG